jgi:hypothetical protein
MAQDEFTEFDEQEEAPVEAATDETEVEAEEQEAEPDQPEESDEETEPESPEGEPSRFDELTERLRTQERRNDELMRMVLEQRKPAEPEVPETPTDPDVEAAIKPILDKRLKPVEAAIQERTQAMQLDQLDQMAPGFKDRWPQIQEEFNKLPPDLQPQFDSMTGALALDGIMRNKASKPSPAKSLKRRSHSETSAPARQTVSKKDVTAEDVHKMTAAEFNHFVESQRGDRGRPGEIDPLLR